MPTVTETNPHIATTETGDSGGIIPPLDRTANRDNDYPETLVLLEAELYASNLAIERSMREMDRQEMQSLGGLGIVGANAQRAY